MSVSFKKKMPLEEAAELAQDLEDCLAQFGFRVQVCGSVRRRKPEVGDLDLVLDGDISRLRSDRFSRKGRLLRWVEGGEKKATLDFHGQQVNVLRSDPEHWGAALLYFTGPHDYNIGMRRLAKGRGLLLNEKGLFRGDELLAAQTEEEIYTALEKQFKEPWLRGIR